jgi:hypothetical protein
MFCLGFTKSISSCEDSNLDEIWANLIKFSDNNGILAKSLYHFLCYLQSYEIAVDIPAGLLEASRPNNKKKEQVIQTKLGIIY